MRARAADRAGVWSQATYDLVRNGEKFQTSLVLVPQAAPKTIRHFLTLVGLLYLFIGTFILLRRWTAPKCLHFYVFCLTSFVLYTFSYTGKLNLFDWTIYWLDVVALLLQPALFLHFALTFPEPKGFVRERRWLIPFVYLPALLLGAGAALVVRARGRSAPGPVPPALTREESARAAALLGDRA